MKPYTTATYIGTGARVTLASILGVRKCKWFEVQPISSGAAAGRVGDSHVALGTRGFPIGDASGAEPGVFAPPIALAMDFYDLTQWYLILGLAETAAVGCAV